MSSLRPMTASDLLKFTTVNLDPLTETYNVGFYLEYLAKWPHLCHVIVDERDRIEGYILAKIEESVGLQQPSKLPYSPDTNTNDNYLPWHAHITALTVAPASRRLGHARKLTEVLEQIANEDKCWFVDLFVRADNQNAIALYRSMGYSVFRRVVEYYNDGADAFDMRKSLKRDKDHKLVRANGENYHVDPSFVWRIEGEQINCCAETNADDGPCQAICQNENVFCRHIRRAHGLDVSYAPEGPPPPYSKRAGKQRKAVRLASPPAYTNSPKTVAEASEAEVRAAETAQPDAPLTPSHEDADAVAAAVGQYTPGEGPSARDQDSSGDEAGAIPFPRLGEPSDSDDDDDEEWTIVHPSVGCDGLDPLALSRAETSTSTHTPAGAAILTPSSSAPGSSRGSNSDSSDGGDGCADERETYDDLVLGWGELQELYEDEVVWVPHEWDRMEYESMDWGSAVA